MPKAGENLQTLASPRVSRRLPHLHSLEVSLASWSSLDRTLMRWVSHVYFVSLHLSLFLSHSRTFWVLPVMLENPAALVYMSPERLLGNSYNSNSDVWALGVCAATCLNGKVLFPTNITFWKLVQMVQAPLKFVKAVDGGGGKGPCNREQGTSTSPAATALESHALLHDFISQCLTVDPTQRPCAKDLLTHPFINLRHKWTTESWESFSWHMRQNIRAKLWTPDHLHSLICRIDERRRLLNLPVLHEVAATWKTSSEEGSTSKKPRWEETPLCTLAEQIGILKDELVAAVQQAHDKPDPHRWRHVSLGKGSVVVAPLRRRRAAAQRARDARRSAQDLDGYFSTGGRSALTPSGVASSPLHSTNLPPIATKPSADIEGDLAVRNLDPSDIRALRRSTGSFYGRLLAPVSVTPPERQAVAVSQTTSNTPTHVSPWPINATGAHTSAPDACAQGGVLSVSVPANAERESRSSCDLVEAETPTKGLVALAKAASAGVGQ